MARFDELKITPGQSIDALEWNALVEKVENLKLEIAPNLSHSTLTLSTKTEENQGWSSLSRDPSSGNLKIQTEHGSLNIGPRSPDAAHLETDRDTFYFNKEIRVDSGKIGSFDEDLSLCTEGTPQMTIKQNGSVGIGTTKPSAKLEVDGQIYSRDGFKFPDKSIQISAVKVQSGTCKLPIKIPTGMWGMVREYETDNLKLSGFSEKPIIICTIIELEMEGPKTIVEIIPFDVRHNRFRIKIQTRVGSKINKLIVKWLAIGR